MAAEWKRFTISIPQSMEADLDAAKQERYYKNSQNDMFRDLICKGLAALKTESAEKSRRRESA